MSGNVPVPSKLLQEAYRPESFQAHGQIVLERLTRYLSQAARGSIPVLSSFDPQLLRDAFQSSLQPGKGELADQLEAVLQAAHHLHHPGFFCAQVVPVLPLCAWCEAVVALLNNSSAVFEMGPVSAALESLLVDWLAERIGYPPGSAGGALTNGGSLGNLTGLLAARQAMAGYDCWEEGMRGDLRPTVLVSEQAHYCVRRAAQVMGWGSRGATSVAVDEHFRMSRQSLEVAYRQALDQGLTPLAVSASACTTSTGAYDPLEVAADFCHRYGLWLHVDGAHGASVLLSQRYRDRVRGIERADSVAWDLHKTMAMPLTTTAILFRRKDDCYRTFKQKADYLFGEGDEEPWYQGALRTLECSKRNMGLSAWMALQLYGEEFFRDYIDFTHDLAGAFATRVRACHDFELLVEPQSNIVCFRYLPPGHGGDLDALQQRLRGLVNRSGEASIGTARLNGQLYLRAVFMSPLTGIEQAERLLSLIRELACP